MYLITIVSCASLNFDFEILETSKCHLAKQHNICKITDTNFVISHTKITAGFVAFISALI